MLINIIILYYHYIYNYSHDEIWSMRVALFQQTSQPIKMLQNISTFPINVFIITHQSNFALCLNSIIISLTRVSNFIYLTLLKYIKCVRKYIFLYLIFLYLYLKTLKDIEFFYIL
jgi:hypothetical protein